ncbi:MAG: hypothetical protein KY446_05290 [Proteobacteria bacterium]|nr:hypothetical protein [Pseudomonadota bacterium]MBW3617156.1 hypothetical protein [Pseudomonadota bacterium]
MRALLTLFALFAASPALADPSGRLYERALMAEADRRCGLFTPEIRRALAVGRIQARNATLRARGDAVRVEHRARERVAALACTSPDLRVAAGRVREGHAGWAQLYRMDFPAATSGWRADRTRSAETRWRVVQTTPKAALGLAGADAGQAALYAVARFRKAETPASARLRVGRRTFLAASRETAPVVLSSAGKGRAWAFRFPPAAVQALAAASTRDTAELSFIRAGRGQTRSVPIEIGDYAAAQAFIGR